MSNQINLTVSLNNEDRARIDAIMFNQEKIIDLLQGKFEPQPQEVEPVKEMAQESENVQENAHQAPEPQPDIGDGTEVPEPHIEAADTEPAPAPSCTREDVQRKVVELAAAGKKIEVRDIVNAYAPRVSAIPDADLDECMAKLVALEG